MHPWINIGLDIKFVPATNLDSGKRGLALAVKGADSGNCRFVEASGVSGVNSFLT
jgi:hypothetical protein